MLELSQPHTLHLPIPGKLLFDRSEFASLTGLSLRTVSYLIADGTIRVKRVGSRVLIPRAELLRFAEIEGPTNRG
jgi:excisionase family DNA binding protein